MTRKSVLEYVSADACSLLLRDLIVFTVFENPTALDRKASINAVAWGNVAVPSEFQHKVEMYCKICLWENGEFAVRHQSLRVSTDKCSGCQSPHRKGVMTFSARRFQSVRFEAILHQQLNANLCMESP